MNDKKISLTPDVLSMERHLEFLFSGLEDYDDGLIEIAYTNYEGKPNKAQYFDRAETKKAAEFAASVNQNTGVNVYVGAALRKPETFPGARSDISDYYVSSVAWADCDDGESVKIARERYEGLPPSFVVVTGRHPTTRAQLWWKLDEPETNHADLKPVLAILCSSMKGDRAVVDPARIMRLAGSIAWPHKEGRVPELTEAPAPQNATPVVNKDRLTSYFSGMAAPLTHSAMTGGVGHDGKPRNAITQQLYIKGLLEAATQAGQWHTNMRDAVAAMVGRNWSDEQILLACQMYCTGGTNDNDVIKLIVTARQKWDKPNPETGENPHALDPETGQRLPIKATALDDIDLENIPPREFLYGSIVGRKYVSMIVAPPGAGKSILTLQLGLYAAAGRPWGDWECKRPVNVWIYNNEEGMDELKRRVRAILMHADLKKNDIAGKLYLDSGENKSISIAHTGQDGSAVAAPDFDLLKAEVIARKIDLLIVDPFAEMHSLNENSNDDIKVAAGLFRKIAFEANCAVLLVHHTRKGAEGANNNRAGDADTARGGGAQIGVVRRAFTIGAMTENDAASLNVPSDERRWFVRFDDAKTNISAPADRTEWFKFKSVSINNGRGIYPEGDSVGVLEFVDIENIQADYKEKNKDEQDKIIFDIVQQMDAFGQSQTSVKDVSRTLIMAGKYKIKDSTLRKKISSAILTHNKKVPIIFNAARHFVSVLEDKGGNNSMIIIRKWEPVDD